jgi:hypothetical protein
MLCIYVWGRFGSGGRAQGMLARSEGGDISGLRLQDPSAWGPPCIAWAQNRHLRTHIYPHNVSASKDCAIKVRRPASLPPTFVCRAAQGAEMREFDHPIRTLLADPGDSRGRSAGPSLAAGWTNAERADARKCCAVCVACGLGRREASSAAQAWLPLAARSTGAAPSPATVCPRPESMTVHSIGVASGAKKRHRGPQPAPCPRRVAPHLPVWHGAQHGDRARRRWRAPRVHARHDRGAPSVKDHGAGCSARALPDTAALARMEERAHVVGSGARSGPERRGRRHQRPPGQAARCRGSRAHQGRGEGRRAAPRGGGCRAGGRGQGQGGAGASHRAQHAREQGQVRGPAACAAAHSAASYQQGTSCEDAVGTGVRSRSRTVARCHSSSGGSALCWSGSK